MVYIIADGGGRGLTKVSRDIFGHYLNEILQQKVSQNLCFCEVKKCHGVKKGAQQYQQMSQGEGLWPAKKCHVLFEWPNTIVWFENK